ELGLGRDAELAHEDDVQGSAERLRHLGRDHDPAPGQPEDDHVVAAQVVQRPGEAPSRVHPIDERHRIAPFLLPVHPPAAGGGALGAAATRRTWRTPYSRVNPRHGAGSSAATSGVASTRGSRTSYRTPRTFRPPVPAARRLRSQSVSAPYGNGTTNPSCTRSATTGVR